VTHDFRTFTTPLDGTGVFLTPLTSGGTPLANSVPRGGNLGRNPFRSPAWQQWNVGLSKQFKITERLGLQVRSDWVNAFNHRNFRVPSTNMNSPAFGTQVNDPGSRDILMVAKITF
jgi:hypothetical protein